MSNVITNPYNFAVAGGAGAYELIDSQTSTGTNPFDEITFADAVDFADYSEMYCTFALGTPLTRDVTFRIGSSSDGGVLTTSSYNFAKTTQDEGTLVQQYVSGEPEFSLFTHPIVESQNGVSGYVRIFKITAGDDDTFLQMSAFAQGTKAMYWCGGKNSTVNLSDLKYFSLIIASGSNELMADSNMSCYKVKRS